MRSPSVSRRNQQVVRQWLILRCLASARYGQHLAALSADLGVTTRTIRRDLEALQSAGFPLVDEIHEDARRWRLLRSQDVRSLLAPVHP